MCRRIQYPQQAALDLLLALRMHFPPGVDSGVTYCTGIVACDPPAKYRCIRISYNLHPALKNSYRGCKVFAKLKLHKRGRRMRRDT